MRKPTGAAIVTVINQISRIAGIIAIIFLVAMMLLTVADVFLRYFFDAPISGTVELIQYFIVVAGFLGLGWCAVKGEHIKVDLIMRRFSPRVQAVVDSITLFLCIPVVALVAWRGLVQARYALQTNDVSDFLEIPAYPFYVVVGLGYAIFLLVLLTILLKLIARAVAR